MRDGAEPFLTYYDGTTGERVELSGTTFDNWVAKTANLLRDQVGISPGGSIGLFLPAHWLTSVWLDAIALSGCTAICGFAPDDPQLPDLDVAVVGPDPGTAVAAAEVIACSLRPLGQPFTEPLPPMVVDFAADVRGHGDHFGTPSALPPGRPAFEVPNARGQRAELSVDAVHAAASATADNWGLVEGGRLLVRRPSDRERPMELWLALLPVLRATDSSLVIVQGYDADQIESISAQEKVTAIADLLGVRGL